MQAVIKICLQICQEPQMFLAKEVRQEDLIIMLYLTVQIKLQLQVRVKIMGDLILMPLVLPNKDREMLQIFLLQLNKMQAKMYNILQKPQLLPLKDKQMQLLQHKKVLEDLLLKIIILI